MKLSVYLNTNFNKKREKRKEKREKRKEKEKEKMRFNLILIFRVLHLFTIHKVENVFDFLCAFRWVASIIVWVLFCFG